MSWIVNNSGLILKFLSSMDCITKIRYIIFSIICFKYDFIKFWNNSARMHIPAWKSAGKVIIYIIIIYYFATFNTIKYSISQNDSFVNRRKIKIIPVDEKNKNLDLYIHLLNLKIFKTLNETLKHLLSGRNLWMHLSM